MSSSRVELNDRLHALLQLPENKVCAECSDPQPSWATIVLPNSEDLLVGCLPLGLFCCLDCSAAHTRLGSNVCMVLSTNLGEWEEDDIVALEQGGNKKINEIFEAKNSLICSLKPRAGADNGQSREQFVFEKYGCRKYFDHTIYVQYSKSKETHVVNSIMERLETMRKNRGDFSSVEAKDGTQADKRIFKKPVNSDSNNDGPRIYQTHNVSPIMLENNTRNVRKQNRTSFSASKTVHEKGGLEKNVGVASGKIETCQMESNRVSSSIMSSSTKQNKTFGIGDNHPIQPQKRSSARDCSLTNSFTRRTRSQNNLASMKDSGTVDTGLDKQDSRRRNRSVSRSKRPSVQDTNMPDIGSSKGENKEDPTRSRTRSSRPLESDVRSRRSRRSQSRNSRNRSKSCNSRRKNNEGACEAVSNTENNICSHQTSMEKERSRTVTKNDRAKEKLLRDHHRPSRRRSSKKINLNDVKELMNSEAKKAEDLPEKRRSSSIKPEFLLRVDSKKMGAQGICSDSTGQFDQSLPNLDHHQSGNFMAKSSNRKKLARSVATEITFSDADFSDSFIEELKTSKSLNLGSDFLLVMADSKKVKAKDLPKRRSLNIDPEIRGLFVRNLSEDDSEHYQSPSASDSNEHSPLDAQQHENSTAGKRVKSSDSKRSSKTSPNRVKSNSAATTKRSSKEFRRGESMRILSDFSIDCKPFKDLSGSVRQKIDEKKGATSSSQSDIIISTSQEKRGRSNHNVQSFEWSRSPVVPAKHKSSEVSVVVTTTGKTTTNAVMHSMSRVMKFRTDNDSSARAA